MMAEYIDRKAVLSILTAKNAPWNAYERIAALPVADVQPVKHGYWKHENYYCFVCSECGNPAEINGYTGEFMNTPYCNECGARMDGEEPIGEDSDG